MQFRRGAEHIAKAQESSGGGNFAPFLPKIYWKGDQDAKFVLILNPIDEIPMVKVQNVWTSEGRSELVVARTDEAIGHSKDPMEEVWGYPATDNNICIAVELDVEYKIVKDRKRPAGFNVKTREFKRSPRGDDGKVIEGAEKEEVTAPVVGFIAQSPANFFNHVASQDANTAPIHETPAQIRRVGTGTDTDYEIELFDDLDLDLTNLIENFWNISYLGDEDFDLIQQASDEVEEGPEGDLEFAGILGGVLLDKLLNEKADQEHYDEVFGQIDTPARYPKKGWKKGGSDEEEKPKRTARSSQRRTRQAEPAADEPQEAAEDPTADGPESSEADAAPAEDKPKRSRARKPKEEKAPAEEKSAVSKDSPVAARLAALREKAAAAKAA
jgi:hypothetical protein